MEQCAYFFFDNLTERVPNTLGAIGQVFSVLPDTCLPKLLNNKFFKPMTE